MHEFDFLEPATLAEASRMAADLGDGVRFIAGGTALVLTLRQRMVRPSHLISLGRIDSLRGIDVAQDGGLRIGALTRHAEIAAHAHVRAHWPMLAGMAARLANPQVRNQGTIGGNLCYADPATDPPACLLDELLTEIRVPPLAPDATGLYTRHLRTAAEHRPLASVALLARRQGSVCTEVRIAVGASTPVPTRVARAEACLTGQAITPALVAEAAAIVAADITPVDDARGSADYRRHIVGVVARRSLAQLFGLPQE